MPEDAAHPALDIPIPGPGAGGTSPPATTPPPSEGNAMPSELDPTISKVLDQAFSKSHQVGMQAADRASAGNDVLAELTRNVFLGEVSKVGTREAAAMQRMDSDKLSEKILNARAVTDQPGHAAAPK